jgi:hypothetical protein
MPPVAPSTISTAEDVTAVAAMKTTSSDCLTPA